MYYKLTSFYQNHRLYTNSRDDSQLRSLTAAGNAEDCDPLFSADGRYFAPCGLIANSLFNDTVLLYNRGSPVVLDGSGIAWKSDLEVKFQNPSTPTDDLCDADAFSNETSQRPLYWPVPACKLGETVTDAATICGQPGHNDATCEYNPWSTYFGSSGTGYTNEDFVVWMRTAVLPTFKKLWRRKPGGLPDGTYTAHIDYNFPVAGFGGTKALVFGTTTAMGGKSSFLPTLYLVMGILMLIAGAVFVGMWKSAFYGIRVLSGSDSLITARSRHAVNVAYAAPPTGSDA